MITAIDRNVLSSIESLADSYSKSITKIDSLFNLNQDISDSELALLREQLGLDAYQNTFNDSLFLQCNLENDRGLSTPNISIAG